MKNCDRVEYISVWLHQVRSPASRMIIAYNVWKRKFAFTVSLPNRTLTPEFADTDQSNVMILVSYGGLHVNEPNRCGNGIDLQVIVLDNYS